MPTHRFVILRHEPTEQWPRELHWDLMLEFEGSLRTWALVSEPRFDEEIAADELPPHRLDYLTYEGPVSRGRGHVTRFDHGSFTVVEDSPDQLCVDLDGNTLNGQLRLAYDAQHQRWIASFRSS